MNVTELGPLRVRRFVVPGENPSDPEGKAPLTVVLMHGFGAPGDDLAGLARAFAGLGAPPGTAFVFPEAPLALGEIGGMELYADARAWWLIDMVRLQRAIARGETRDLSRDVPEGLAAAREKVLAMLDALAPARLVLGGFSQGAMLATDVALRTERALEGLVVLSGTLLAEHEWRPLMRARAGLRVFQSHGSRDPLLPYELAERLRDALRDAGLDVTFAAFDDGHGIPPDVLRELTSFLRSIA